MAEFIEEVQLTDDERESLARSLRWHFKRHASEPDKSYDSLGIENAVVIVQRILTNRIAAERGPRFRPATPSEGSE